MDRLMYCGIIGWLDFWMVGLLDGEIIGWWDYWMVGLLEGVIIGWLDYWKVGKRASENLVGQRKNHCCVIVEARLGPGSLSSPCPAQSQ